MSTSGHSIESDQLRELREQLAAQEKVIAANEQQIAAGVCQDSCTPNQETAFTLLIGFNVTVSV